jgi:uncharacterized protein (DUF952 family)
VICHVTSPALWLQALHRGTIWAPSLDNEGFIHCSRLTQIETVVNRFYANTATLILVGLDESLMGDALVWEGAAHPDGSPATTEEQFPHYYGHIDMSTVQWSHGWRANRDGHWELPIAPGRTTLG